MKPEDFISLLTPGAQAAQVDTKVPASVTVAQAALESGWGEHAPGKNLFGIKATPDWTGPVTIKKTRECIKGKWIVIDARFRAYNDWAGSIHDHAQFLVENPRYAPAFQHTDNGCDFAMALAGAGYATDPDYGKKLISLIRWHSLWKLDTA